MVGTHGSHTGLWLFITSACFFLLCTTGHINTPDGVIMFQVTQSIVDKGQVSIPGLSDWPGFGGTMAQGRRDEPAAFYSKYGLGLSLAAIPTYAIGRLLAPLADARQLELFRIPDMEQQRTDAFARRGSIVISEREDFRKLWYDPTESGSRQGFLAFCAAWTNSFVVAGIVVGIFLICREIGHSPRLSIVMAVLAGVATPLWEYAKDFFSEPLAGLGLTYFLYFWLRARSTKSVSLSALSGAALALAPLSKPALIIVAIPGVVLILAYARGLARAQVVGRLVAFGVGLVAVAGLVFLYNYSRFGSLFETGYGEEAGAWTTPMMVGVLGLLVSPGRGLLIYSPSWILLALRARRFLAERRPEFVFAVLSLTTLVAFYAKWYRWEGGACWGPRFLIPAIPILVVPIASVLAEWRSRYDVRLVAGTVIALSAVIAFSGTLVNYMEHWNWVRWQVLNNSNEFAAHGITSPYQLLVWSPRYAAVFDYWSFPRKDFYFLFDAMQRPGLVLGIYSVFGAGFVGGSTLLYRTLRRFA